ncbi:PAS domain-containing protein [Streptomyces sp. AV19]|uniref:PAS domain-containing protein n=1 Tax=Streptomyces sp. AV19 TaxID=2793068 RepID=UPI0018FE74FF|nr:PAS domain-containing protein [Streptomyces sp. AV19]MBH1934787.1 PAS domain-containing protein [Streptomyces sp. AV19]MDG4530606.1 PAS domain-containing protein [Streptomyces sp. AV19]
MSSRPSRGAARLAAILDALPDALLLVNCNGTVVNANHIALETFEVPGTGLVGRGLLDLLPAFDSRRIPGSMRLPDHEANGGRTKPTRMIARRTDGTQFPVEVSSANLTDGRTPYADQGSYTGDELLMLVVRDLTGTLDTEAELARQQRQTEMILRAAAEGVVGVDTAGKVVLVNPSAAQILGYRASDLGGRELHPLIHHSRADGSPFPYEESPVADTLRSGRKHRVRGQVLWAKDGRAVPVDLTTAPVRDGDQLVGAVMTFTDRRPYDALAARHAQLTAVLDSSLRGPLDRLRGELGALAADPAGQLWPEANQILHHLAAGYGRMARLVDNVLEYQRLEAGESKVVRAKAQLDEVVAAGVEGAVELIGPGRAQFAVHAPAIEAEVDAEWFARALAHLIADVAGVDSTGDAPAGGAPSGDSTIVVAAAKRDTAVRIEVRGPYPGGDPVHGPVVRGIVRRHGGVLQTHDVPGAAGGKAYVLEVPVSADAGPVAPGDRPDSPPSIGSGTTIMPMPGQRTASAPVPEGGSGGKGPAAPEVPSGPRPEVSVPAQPTGRRRGPARADEEDAHASRHGRDGEASPAPAPTGRRARREAATATAPGPDAPRTAFALPPAEADRPSGASTGRRARRALPEAPEHPAPGGSGAEVPRTAFALPPAEADRKPEAPAGEAGARPVPARSGPVDAAAPGAQNEAGAPEAAGNAPLDVAGLLGITGQRGPVGAGGVSGAGGNAGQNGPSGTSAPAGPDAGPVAPGAVGNGPLDMAGLLGTTGRREPVGAGGDIGQSRPSGAPVPGATAGHSGPVEPPVTAGNAGTSGPGGGPAPATGTQGRPVDPAKPADASGAPAGPGEHATPDGAARTGEPVGGWSGPGGPVGPVGPVGPAAPVGASGHSGPTGPAGNDDSGAAAPRHPGGPSDHTGPAAPTGRRRARRALAEEPGAAAQQGGGGADGTAQPISVRTLGQGAPFAHGGGDTQASGTGVGSGRRRKLGNPTDGEREAQAQAAAAAPRPGPVGPRPPAAPQGRAFAIGAPDEGAEGPEPLDGPNGAVEIVGTNEAVPPPVDDELPPEPLDNPRRLLVWPAPDASTRQALTDRGYRPVIVHSREEVDAQMAAYPAALFVDPLTGPITRTALQALRQAAVESGVPVLVTAGLGQATREAAYGADPAVLLKALAPRDSEMHPPRVLLVEEHTPIADALTATLERRGVQVACAATDAEAVALAEQMRPNLVVMDLMQVRRRRTGILDWLRDRGHLERTPLVVYTSAGIDPAQLPRLASGETVLFLAERSTSPEVQGRIVDLLAKIGTGPA